MSFKSKFMLGALSTAMILHSALAQDTSAESRHEMLKQKRLEHLQKKDKDGNGMISKAEYMAEAEARFKRRDANGDGQISPQERAAKRNKAHQHRQERRHER